jgi:hypothetical protein
MQPCNMQHNLSKTRQTAPMYFNTYVEKKYKTLRTLAISIFPFQLTVSCADVEVVRASDVSTVKPHKNACLFALCRSSCRHSIVKKCSTNITSKRLCLLVCIITNIVQNSTAFTGPWKNRVQWYSTQYCKVIPER